MKVSDLRPAPYNPRRITAEALAGLRVSLRELGDISGIVWNKRSGHLVCGHQRLEALKQEHGRRLKILGEAVVTPSGERFPIRVVDWPEEKEKAANLAANNPGLMGDFTAEASALIAEVRAGSPELAGGLRLDEIEAVLAEAATVERPGLTDPDDIPEPPADPITKPGDLWVMGEHRVLCGDATSKEDVGRVSQGGFDIMVSDPPYCSGGFQEAGKAAGSWGKIASDNLSTRGWAALLNSMLAAARPQTAYLFTDWRMWIGLYDIAESNGIAVRSMIVWDKGTPGLGALWRTQHELVMFASRETNKRRKGLPATGNVIQCKRTGNVLHYTQKPTELLGAVIKNDASSGRGGAVYDPFAGSGTTLIAAEQLGRRCYAIEIEPRYCDVIVKRWEDYTGKKAELGTVGRRKPGKKANR